ncbi:MAG: ABC transporter permease [Coriobacteriia bacterium]|nr:ABC transporter permease [Coriobacteriia bacterium]
MVRRVIALAWLNLLQLFRTPAELVVVLAIPLALTFVFGAAFSASGDSPIRVLFVDEDGSPKAQQVRTLLAEEGSFAVEDSKRQAAEKLVVADKAPVAVIVPAGFADAADVGNGVIEALMHPESSSALGVTAVLEGIAVRMSAGVAATKIVSEALPADSGGSKDSDVGGRGSRGNADSGGSDAIYEAADALWEPDPPVSIRGETVIASNVRGSSVQAEGTTQYSAGFTLYFILFTVFGGAGAILEEREHKTLSRLLVAPTSKRVLLAGKVAGIVLAAVVQTLVLTVAGAVLFGVPWGGQWLASGILLLAYILSVTGVAVLLSTLVRSRGQFTGASPVLTTGLAMLGGCMWPLDIVPPAMRTVAKATPTGWAMSGLTDVLARNHGLEAVWLPSLVLVVFAIVALCLASVLLRWE